MIQHSRYRDHCNEWYANWFALDERAGVPYQAFESCLVDIMTSLLYILLNWCKVSFTFTLGSTRHEY